MRRLALAWDFSSRDKVKVVVDEHVLRAEIHVVEMEGAFCSHILEQGCLGDNVAENGSAEPCPTSAVVFRGKSSQSGMAGGEKILGCAGKWS